MLARPQEETHDTGFLTLYSRVKNHGKDTVTLAMFLYVLSQLDFA